jgi:lysine decarboxylase
MDIPSLDRTKLNIDMSAYGINGNQLEEMLMEKGIFVELVTGNIVMCMTGIGNRREDFSRLIDELRHISTIHQLLPEDQQKQQPAALTKRLEHAAVPQTKVFVPLDEAEGRVCASSIIPYPPGIPMACPGDIIDREVIEYVKARRAAHEKVIGVNEKGEVVVGE